MNQSRAEICKRYEKTKKGFLVRAYRNMQSRILGIQRRNHQLYAGKTLLDRNDFYVWSLSSDKFHELFDLWRSGGYKRPETPSVDRVNSSLGYEIPNMEWVTLSENSKRGAMTSAIVRRAKAKHPPRRRRTA